MFKRVNLALAVALFVSAAVIISTVDAIGQDSCKNGRCNKTGTDPNFDCQCNKPCKQYGDCCNDYDSECLGVNPPTGSCVGKCNAAYDPSSPCQCNSACASKQDCCQDYEQVCGGGGDVPVTDSELINLSEIMHSLESSNNAAEFVTTDLQGQTSQSSTRDEAPLPLLTVKPEAFQKPTIQLLTKLYNNYIADVANNEVITDEELAEESVFLDAVFATPVFQRAKEFLIEKKFLTEANFRDEFYRIWFGQYSRATGKVGSSGFEHVFMGELKSGVSGFHNWIYFNDQEETRDMNYRGWLDYKSFGEKGALVAHNFAWRNQGKPISSMFIGSSPELELSVFTVCWYARPNSKCVIQFNGTKFYVQTYDITYNSKKYVASSYADIST